MRDTAVDQGEGSSSPDKITVNTSGGSYVEGNVNTSGGDFVGRDKHVINNIINNLIQQASSAAEELDKQNKLETLRLAQGVMAFVERLKKSASDHTGTVYKGLLEYGLGDAEMFFGRDEAGHKFIKIIERGRLTVIQAESGAGKSSFLQAKISPALLVAGHLPIYLRSYTNDPVVDIKSALLPHLNQNQTLKQASLRDFLLAVGGVLPQARLYIFLDQFEELFTQFDEDIRAAFVRQLSECVEDTSLDVRWVLSLRTEFFGRLANYEPPLHPFHNQYLLDSLKREEAEQAIVQPAVKIGVKFEAGLVDTILDDLGRNERSGDLIAPPQLQLVCLSLYDSLDGAQEITRKSYDLLGGTTGILSSYLKKVIRNLPEDEREVAPKLLEALINSNKQRVRRTKEELANDPGLRSAQPGSIDKTLERLGDQRLLRVQEGDAPGIMTYELAHDYLVNDISVDERVLARKRVQELLDRRLLEFKQHKILLGAEELAIINPYRQELTVSSETEELIAASERKLKLRRRMTISFAGIVAILAVVTAILVVFAIRSARTIRNAEDSMRSLFENNGIVPIGQSPQALAYDGKRIWVASSHNALQAIDPQTGKIEKVLSLNQSILILHFDGKRLWVAGRSAGRPGPISETLQAIDPDTGKPGREIKLPSIPFAMISDGQRIWISFYFTSSVKGGAVSSINPETGDVSPPIEVARAPESLAFDGKRVWVASRFGTVQSIDPASGKVSDPVQVNFSPNLMVYGGRHLWLASKEFSIIKVLDPETGEIITPTPREGDSIISNTILALIFAGSRLWVTTTDNNVRAIDPETYEVSEPVQVGSSPVAIAFDGMRLWIANRDNMTVQAIDPAAAFVGEPVSLRIPRKDQAGFNSKRMAVSGGRLYVAQDDVILPLDLSRYDYWMGNPIRSDFCASALTVADNKLWVADACNGSVRAVDLQTLDVGDPIKLGSQPLYMIFDGVRLWVSDPLSHSVQAIDVSRGIAYPAIHMKSGPGCLAFDGKRVWVATNVGLQLIDPEKGQVISTISDYVNQTDMIFAAGRLWIAGLGSEVRAIDPDTQSVAARIELGSGLKLFAFDGSRLWVVNHETHTLRAIDPNSLSVGMPIAIGTNPINMIFDGKRLWIYYQNMYQSGSNVVQPVTVYP